jgi:hypothetical protein
LLTDLGISVATGEEWLGYPTEKGRVLYVNFELPAAFFAKRIQTICDERQLKLEPEMFSVLNLRGHVADWARLRQQIPPGQYVLLIIDPSYKLLLWREENKAGDIASLMENLKCSPLRPEQRSRSPRIIPKATKRRRKSLTASAAAACSLVTRIQSSISPSTKNRTASPSR